MKILIVDDEEELSQHLKIFLSRRGYEVLSALDGEAGLRMFLDNQPDWLLLDHNLPKLKGKDVLAKIRQNYPQAKICFWTGNEDEVLKKEVEALGANKFMYKPIDVAVLMETLLGNGKA
jgi:DNA-binding response OmpR family regulator